MSSPLLGEGQKANKSKRKEKMRWIRVEVGLLILLFSFAVSFVGGVSIGPFWRIIAILEANPHRYLEYVWNAVLYLILPPSVVLAFFIIGYVRERKSPTGILDAWPILVVFGFILIFFWGVLVLRYKYTSYCDAINWLTRYGNAPGLEDLILAIYATSSAGYVLWVFAGVLLMLSPIFKILLQIEE